MFEILKDECTINKCNYELSYIEDITKVDFIKSAIQNYPSRLFKYFSNIEDYKKNINHSFEALKEDTVYMQNPFNYNDPYDSRIYINDDAFDMQRLKYYMDFIGIQYCEYDGINVLVDKFSLKLYEHILANQNSVYSVSTLIEKKIMR